MKRMVNGLIVLAVLALIGAAVVWWLLRDSTPSEEQDRAGRPSEKPVSLISSTGVEKNIARRLTARAGREVEVECPPQFNELVGTTFDCQARFADDAEVATVAKVKVTGAGGQFTWTSENAPQSQPTGTPEPE